MREARAIRALKSRLNRLTSKCIATTLPININVSFPDSGRSLEKNIEINKLELISRDGPKRTYGVPVATRTYGIYRSSFCRTYGVYS
jgi:hypothetical protein